jgi:hypothetical protein
MVRGGGAGQGEVGGSSPGMANDGEGRSATDVSVVQRRRGASMIVGGSGGVVEHEGAERKVRGMATWPEGLRRRCSPEGGGRRRQRRHSWGRQRCSDRRAAREAKRGGDAREVLHGRASGEGKRKKWSAAVSAPF